MFSSWIDDGAPISSCTAIISFLLLLFGELSELCHCLFQLAALEPLSAICQRFIDSLCKARLQIARMEGFRLIVFSAGCHIFEAFVTAIIRLAFYSEFSSFAIVRNQFCHPIQRWTMGNITRLSECFFELAIDIDFRVRMYTVTASTRWASSCSCSFGTGVGFNSGVFNPTASN